MKINWDSVYEGTIGPLAPKVDYWGGDEADAEYLFSILPAQPQQNNKKFDVPIKPIPWFESYEENVHLTLEWLMRDHRANKVRLSEEPTFQHVREFWFRSEHYEGSYAHVCYPKEILNFRMQYAATYAELLSLPRSEMSTSYMTLKTRLKGLLWAQWRCIGTDGDYRGNAEERKPTYTYECSRCCIPMPKAIKAYVKLTQSKLKDCIS